MDLLTLSIIFTVTIGFIVVSTTWWHLHPFLALIFAAYGIGIATGIPLLELGETIRTGFGNILGYIGLVILFGTLIGTILEKSNAAITMANAIQRKLSERHPAMAMTLIGYIVSIPVFCDSAFVILSSLRRSLISRTGVSAISVTIALSAGLYASHTFVPPTPGPIAAAANLGISDNLGLVIAVGLVISLTAALAGNGWARYAASLYKTEEDREFEHVDYAEPDKNVLCSLRSDLQRLKQDVVKRVSVLHDFFPAQCRDPAFRIPPWVKPRPVSDQSLQELARDIDWHL